MTIDTHSTKNSKMRIVIFSLFFFVCAPAIAQVASKRGEPVVSNDQKRNTVTGTILDAASKKPAPGVRVQVEGVSVDITDSLGNFSLKVPSLSAELLITGDGFATRQEPLKGRTIINISLLDDSHGSIHDNVVLPLGEMPQRNTTASVQQYNVNTWTNADEMPDAALQGRIAGLQVTRRSGMQGAGASMFLRGNNSLYATNKPLIVVDNMIYDDNEYGRSLTANSVINPLSLIDMKDIDNISVIKDASSIYGTKGANGAIIITTAHTKDQATKISFASYAGYNEAPANLPVLNAADYRLYLGDVLKTTGISNTQVAAMPYMNDDRTAAGYFTYHNNTDWQKKVLSESYTNNYYLKVSGGDNIATYGLSMGFMKSQGVVKTTDLSRYNTRFNAEFNFSKRFKGYTNLAFTYNEQQLKDQGIADKTSPIFLALTKSPFLNDKELNDLGVESPNLSNVDILGKGNPSAIIQNMQAYNRYYRFFGSFGFKFDISKKFSATSLFGIVYDKIRENIFVPGKGVAKDTLSNAVANNRLGTQVKRLFSFYNDTHLDYVTSFNQHNNFAAHLGLRYQNNDAEQDFALGFNSATDELVSVQNGVSALRQVGGGIGQWNWMNAYLGADYNYKQKIFLTMNAALDGSSRFGVNAKEGIEISGRKFPVLPSIGFAYLLSSEKFMANSFIDILKLRLGIGYSGNDDIGNYNSRQTYGSQNMLGLQGLVRNGIANTSLQWETTQKRSLGMDLATWNERLNISVDLYDNYTTNMLVYESLPVASGFGSVLSNSGAMSNRGVEVSVNARLVQRPSLKWDLGFNIGKNKSNIDAVPGGSLYTNYANATLITANGQAASLFYGYQSMGIFKTAAEASTSALTTKNNKGEVLPFQAGDVKFKDLNGDKNIDENDRAVIGNPNPDFYGGINSRLIWKRFELNALFTFSKGNDVFNYLRYRLESQQDASNQIATVNNRWRTEGQITDMPRASWGDPLGNNRFSERWIEDGSYFRLRSLSVSYNIPLKSGLINDINIYVNGSNLFTLTNYKGFDPEFSVGSNLFVQGIDTGLQPQFKNVTLGLRLGL